MAARQDSGPAAPPRAAALAYEPRDAATGHAPRVVAKGQGPVAEEIIRRARESGVPIHRSRELVAALMQFDLDQSIAPALYVAVAEVLAWAYQLEADALPVGLP
jgi:flagellar biosynthesis protein